MQVTDRKKSKDKTIISSKVMKNLSLLRDLLQSNQNEILSLSSSQNNKFIYGEQYLAQSISSVIKQFLKNIQNPYKSIILMSELLQKKYNQNGDPIFNDTMFHHSLHPILTLYLYNQTSYLLIKRNPSRIVDVFYKYLLFEENSLMEINLHNGINSQSSIGSWLIEEGINRMFKKYYSDKESFTRFISNFMYYGIGYLFLSAVRILRSDKRVLKFEDIQRITLNNIQICYIKKYRLDYPVDSLTSPYDLV